MKILIVYASLLLFASSVSAQHQGSGSIHVMSAWSRALPPVSENGAAYLTLKNYSEASDRLVGASSPVSARVEIHTHEMEAGLMKMRRLESVILNPGEYVKFEPGKRHLMLIGLKQPLRKGDSFPLTLEFEKAPTLEVVVTIESMGADGPETAGHEHSEMHPHHQGHGHGMAHEQKKEKTAP